MNKEERTNTKPQENKWAFMSKPSGLMATDPVSNKPCKPQEIHGSGDLLMVEILKLAKSSASSISESKEQPWETC